VLAVAGVVLITAALVPFRDEHGPATALLLNVLLIVGVAIVGGAVPAVAVAVAAFFAVNWFLTPPYHGLHIENTSNLLGLLTFLVVGSVVSFLVDRVIRAEHEADALERERQQLQLEAAEAAVLFETDRLRTALLRAVSHDLRTPLASIKASVSSLLQDDVDWSPEATIEFLTTIEEETDRLDRVVGNLLDMGRLQAGALQVSSRPVALEEVVPAALTSLSTDTTGVDLEIDETSPRVEADPVLLERALANVVSNALAWTAHGTRVSVAADETGDQVELRVVDHGPGVPLEHRERLFEPFQRLGDRSNDTGAGLGLAVARGFVDAMGGRMRMEDTPGGGLTMVIVLRGAA
jgi:two-component system sensor histidine kinase KdpD